MTFETTRARRPVAWAARAWDAIGKSIARALACLLLLPGWAAAQTILDARYDAATDALLIEIAYQGTNPDHQFELEWDSCQKSPNGGLSIVARLVDRQGQDAARKDYEVTRRFSLAGMSCRPAEVTVRLGPTQNRTVSVPARGR